MHWGMGGRQDDDGEGLCDHLRLGIYKSKSSGLLRYNYMPSTSMACPDDLEQRAPEVSMK